MNERERRRIEGLRADQALIREAAQIVRTAPSRRWAGLDDPSVAERVAEILDLLANHLEQMHEHDRAHLVRVAGDLVGRQMDRPTVRRTRRR